MNKMTKFFILRLAQSFEIQERAYILELEDMSQKDYDLKL